MSPCQSRKSMTSTSKFSTKHIYCTYIHYWRCFKSTDCLHYLERNRTCNIWICFKVVAGTIPISMLPNSLSMEHFLPSRTLHLISIFSVYCIRNSMKPLSTADFGKVMKQVYPRVRPRRLGTRGNSRYCYAGMRKRIKLDPPTLPKISGPQTVSSKQVLIYYITYHLMYLSLWKVFFVISLRKSRRVSRVNLWMLSFVLCTLNDSCFSR